MLEIIQAMLLSFGALFPVVNPIGSAIIILSLVNGASSAELNRLAIKIGLYMSIMLIVMLFAGAGILRLFGITIPIVLIGGGLVLAYIGWQLLNKADGNPEEKNVTPNGHTDYDQIAFYPLTMPITAGPGCIAVAITLGAHAISPTWQITFYNEIGNSIGIILLGLLVWICYRYSYFITLKLGAAGTKVIMRLAAFINLCIGLQLMWHGIKLLT